MEQPKIPQQSQKVRPLAIALLEDIKSGATDPETLSTEKKMLCVHFMIQSQSYTIMEMATFLKVNRATIFRYKKKLYQEDSLTQLIIDESTIALELIDTAQHASAKLMSDKKYKDAWTVRRECVEMLQTLGYVKQVPRKIDVKGALDLVGVLNLEAQMREQESPDNGDDDNADSNGNGHSGAEYESGSRLEDVP
jgi:hypothetical protein